MPAPARDWIWFVATFVPPFLTLCALIVGINTLRNSIRQWRWTFCTKEWSTLMQMLANNARYMDPANTADYKNKFTGDEAPKYDLIARLCIGYLDDLWFLGSEQEMKTWFCGSMRLFGGTHRAWLRDHSAAYDPRFYNFLDQWLNDNKV
ncbi:MAG TPA: hypothetical protein VKB93_06620 [Thermoanaerobaculia bacterium]|nr:hypothetical protein [Thermoanaerobaculia bacterium]